MAELMLALAIIYTAYVIAEGPASAQRRVSGFVYAICSLTIGLALYIAALVLVIFIFHV